MTEHGLDRASSCDADLSARLSIRDRPNTRFHILRYPLRAFNNPKAKYIRISAGSLLRCVPGDDIDEDALLEYPRVKTKRAEEKNNDGKITRKDKAETTEGKETPGES